MISSERDRLLRRIRVLVVLFIIALALSGLTAFPLTHELDLLVAAIDGPALRELTPEPLRWWIHHVRDGLAATYRDYPFIGYGTDWLAFGHLIIALFFIGPLRDPVRNVWVLQAGLIACFAVIPLALICGPIRGIPFYWQLVDCSFGVFGAIPLSVTLRMVRRLSAMDRDSPAT